MNILTPSHLHILASSLLHILTPLLLFCSCRSSDIATRESSIENRMQETISQDSIHVSQLRFDSVIVEQYLTVETIRDTVYIRQESNKQHFSILRDTVYVARSDTVVREVEVIKEKELVKTAPQRKPFISYLIASLPPSFFSSSFISLLKADSGYSCQSCQTHFDSAPQLLRSYEGNESVARIVRHLFSNSTYIKL